MVTLKSLAFQLTYVYI